MATQLTIRKCHVLLTCIRGAHLLDRVSRGFDVVEGRETPEMDIKDERLVQRLSGKHEPPLVFIVPGILEARRDRLQLERRNFGWEHFPLVQCGRE